MTRLGGARPPAGWSLRDRMRARKGAMLLLTLVPSFVPQLVAILGSTVIYLPVVTLIISLLPDSTMSVGEVTQKALSLWLTLPSVFIGLVCALIVQDSIAGFLVLMFVQCFVAFHFQCDEQAPQHKIPGALTVILMNSISLSGYLYAEAEGAVPVDKLLVYMGEIALSFSLGIVAVIIPALVIFPWTACSAYRSLEKRVRSQVAARIRLACATARKDVDAVEIVCDENAGDPREDDSKGQETEPAQGPVAGEPLPELRQNLVQLGTFATASVSECRWRFDGSGMRFLASYRVMWQITRLAMSFERATVGLSASERLSAPWQAMENLMLAICRALESGTRPSSEDLADCTACVEAAGASLAASQASDVCEDSLLSIAWLTGTRMVDLLPQLSVDPAATGEDSVSAWSLEDWRETVLFGRRTAKHSFFQSEKEITVLQRFSAAYTEFTSTHTFAAALKGAMSSTLFVAIIFGSGLAPVIGVNAIVNGLHALQSVLRQMYLGACLKRTYDRAIGSAAGFVIAAAAWLIACAPTFAASGRFEDPALSGWPLVLLALPIYAYHVMGPNYYRYSIVKVYAIVCITGTFQLHGVNEVYQGFWESAGIMTLAIAIGCVFGAMFCPVVNTVSAKASLKTLMIRSMQDFVHVVQSGYFRALDPSAIPEFALDATLWEVWHESRARGSKLLKGAMQEDRFGEPVTWYKEALALVITMDTDIWRLMTLVDWTAIPEDIRRAVSEELCTNLFFVSATLEKNSICSIFRPPQMTLLSVSQSFPKLDTDDPDRIMTALCSRTVLASSARSLSASFQKFSELTRQKLGHPRYAVLPQKVNPNSRATAMV